MLMRRPLELLIVLLAAMGASLSLARAQDEDTRRVFDSLYGQKVKAAQATRDASDDVALAQDMLDAARKSTDQPKLLALICEAVYNLGAADASGHEHAARAMQLLAATDPARAASAQERVVELRRKAFTKARADDRAAAGGLLIDAMLEQAQGKSAANDHNGAAGVLRQALAVARQVKAANAEDVRLRLEDATNRHRMREKLEALQAKLLQNPRDVAAGLEWAMLHIVDLDDPAGAVRHIDQVSDAVLKERLKLAAGKVDALNESQAQALAQWYRELAAKASAAQKTPLLLRVVALSERFLVLHTTEDLARKGVKLAMDEAVKSLATAGVKPPTPADPPSISQTPPKPDPVRPGSGKIIKSDPNKPASLQKWPADKSLPVDTWFELLTIVDPAKHTKRGKWETKDGALFCPPGEPHSKIIIPLSISGDYEVWFDIQAMPHVGTITYILPTPHGYDGIRDDVRVPTGSGMVNGLVRKVTLKVKEKTSCKLCDVDYKGSNLYRPADPRLTQPIEVPFANLLPTEPDNGQTISFYVTDMGVSIKSVKFRLLKGEATLTGK